MYANNNPVNAGDPTGLYPAFHKCLGGCKANGAPNPLPLGSSGSSGGGGGGGSSAGSAPVPFTPTSASGPIPGGQPAYSYSFAIGGMFSPTDVMSYYQQNFRDVFPMGTSCDAIVDSGQECDLSFLGGGPWPVRVERFGLTVFSFLALPLHFERGARIAFSTYRSSQITWLNVEASGSGDWQRAVGAYAAWRVLADNLRQGLYGLP